MTPQRRRWADIFRDPLVLANLALRLVLAGIALGYGHWSGGDTGNYLGTATLLSDGLWRVPLARPPLYSWFLALLTPHVVYSPSSAQIAYPLLAQTLLVWLGGVVLYRRTNRLAAFFWLFEPALLVYSHLIMSDAFFAVCMLLLGLAAQDVLAPPARQPGRAPRAEILFGLAFALVTLTRSIGSLMAVIATVLLVASRWRQPAALKRLVAAALAAAALIGPVVAWNATHFQLYGLSTQGNGWLASVAGVVENDGTGLDFIHSEWKFEKDHGGSSTDPLLPAKVIVTHLPTWAKLTGKGMLRVLIGHVNVEGAYLLTGVSPLGPAWFKAAEDRPGTRVEGWGLVAWTLGVALTALFTLALYWLTLRAIRRRGWRLDWYSIWALGCAAVLATAPQIYGDARFRCGPWPLLVLVWAWNASPRSRTPDSSS